MTGSEKLISAIIGGLAFKAILNFVAIKTSHSFGSQNFSKESELCWHSLG